MLLRSARDSGSATPTTARRGTRFELLDGRQRKNIRVHGVFSVNEHHERTKILGRLAPFVDYKKIR